MKLGLNLGYWQRTLRRDPLSVQAAERLGYDSVWTAEAYGSDAFTPLAWYGAPDLADQAGHLGGAAQRPDPGGDRDDRDDPRPPHRRAAAARARGVGAPGRGGLVRRPFARPLARTREYVEIMRKIWRREEPVTNDGPHYPLPLPSGKPLKLITHPLRADIPVYLGAEGPKNVALAAEIGQGWLPLFAIPSEDRVHVRGRARHPCGGLRRRRRWSWC